MKHYREMTLIKIEEMEIPICEDCLKGDHNHFGGLNDCKHVSKDGQTQCNCNLNWKELQSVLEGK